MISGESVGLEVKDTGKGISEEIKSLMFDPFYSTKERGKGTGMGLSLVHGIVHSCDGHILVQSTPDSGTTFCLLFPKLNEKVAVTETSE